jgi:hypothetical protein
MQRIVDIVSLAAEAAGKQIDNLKVRSLLNVFLS